MPTQIQIRRDTGANWTSNNPILAQGEIGLDLTNTRIKIGNGTSTWTLLPYFNDQGIDAGGGDRLVNGVNEIVLAANGALAFPRGAIQQDSNSVTCQTGVDTVVFTSSAQGIQTIKLVLQVEGTVTTGDADTQSCEMIVAKGFRGPTVAATVYAVVHTSVAPLATFTAQWNAVSSRVEVTCRPTSLTNSVAVKSFATEITTSD
jgi:hypothetical protein